MSKPTFTNPLTDEKEVRYPSGAVRKVRIGSRGRFAAAPLEERFWRRVKKTDGCWEWTGGLLSSGYGACFVGAYSTGAHRVSWELANGPIPDGLWVLHHCDNRPCVRPDHLFLGTVLDNNRDAIAKGRRRLLAAGRSK